MRTTTVASLFFTIALIHSASALKCYECTYIGKTAEGDNQCKDGGDIFGDSGMEPIDCEEGYNVCVFNYSIDEEENENFTRGCGTSSKHNDEEDKCISYDRWGEEHHECVCSEDECNGSTVVKASSIVLVPIFFLLWRVL